jgi:spore coat polysaccharide biosynthesis protein SpsF
MGSSRLPGKLLAPLAGRPLISVLYERVRHASVDEWWLATTSTVGDDVTEAWGVQLGLKVFRGDEDNVLSRFTGILKVKSTIPKWVVRLTADNPFVDATLVNMLIEQAEAMGEDKSVMSDDAVSSRLPLGYVPEVVRARRLAAIDKEIPADKQYHRTHVLSWLYDCGEAAVFSPPSGWVLKPQWRWTVDTPKDLEMAKRSFEILGERWDKAGYAEMERILSIHPDVTDINTGIVQKAVKEG